MAVGKSKHPRVGSSRDRQEMMALSAQTPNRAGRAKHRHHYHCRPGRQRPVTGTCNGLSESGDLQLESSAERCTCCANWANLANWAECMGYVGLVECAQCSANLRGSQKCTIAHPRCQHRPEPDRAGAGRLALAGKVDSAGETKRAREIADGPPRLVPWYLLIESPASPTADRSCGR